MSAVNTFSITTMLVIYTFRVIDATFLYERMYCY